MRYRLWVIVTTKHHATSIDRECLKSRFRTISKWNKQIIIFKWDRIETVHWHAYHTLLDMDTGLSIFIDHKTVLVFLFYHFSIGYVSLVWFPNYDWYFQARAKRLQHFSICFRAQFEYNKVLAVFGATSYQIEVVSINKSSKTRAEGKETRERERQTRAKSWTSENEEINKNTHRKYFDGYWHCVVRVADSIIWAGL